MGRIEYIHKLLANREISARELAQKYLEAIDRDNGALNAYVNITREAALESADKADRAFAKGEDAGLLTGIPMALKDNISTRNIETTCCSKILKGYKPLYDATAWSRLKAQGAVLLGKTNMDEFAMGSSCETSCFGPAHNPFDIARSTGGSSGGSAGAVAGNLAVYSLGSDTGGSVRQPAAFCGLVGLKPTYGAVSRSGLVAFASSLDQIGLMTHTVEDAAIVFDAIAGGDPMDSTSNKSYVPRTFENLNNDIKGKTLGIVSQLFSEVSPEVTQAVDSAIKTFEEMGVNIVPIDIPEVNYALPAYHILACAEASSNLARYDGVRYGHRTLDGFDNVNEMMTKTRSEGFSQEVKRRILMGTYVLSQGYYDAYYKKAQILRQGLCGAFEKAFLKCDAILAPTTPTTAFRIGTQLSPVEAYKADICTVAVNIAGLPSASICCGYSHHNLPVGMQLISRRFGEETILNFAYKFQQETDFVRTTDWGVRL